MFKENRTINFETLEPSGKKKKKGRSDFFEYKVEVPGHNVASFEKAKNISEHKEVLMPKIFPKIIPKPAEDDEKADKVLEELNYLGKKCLKCESDNLQMAENKNLSIMEFKCLNCGYTWEELLNNLNLQ